MSEINNLEKQLNKITTSETYKLEIMRKYSFDRFGQIKNHRIYDIFRSYVKKLDRENKNK